MCHKLKEIMKEEKCFACDKKTKRKKTFRHGVYTFIGSVAQWLRCWIINPGIPCSNPLGVTDLVEEMANPYEIYGVEGEVDDNKKTKSLLLTNFPDNLRFTPVHGIHGKPMIVHSVGVNPVDYAMTLIIGAGLGDKEIILAFAKMINHKLESQDLSKNSLYLQEI